MYFVQQSGKYVKDTSFFAQTTLKMQISTSVWIAQHPKAGENILGAPTF